MRVPGVRTSGPGITVDVPGQVRACRAAARECAKVPSQVRQRILHRIADAVSAELPAILEINRAEAERASGLSGKARARMVLGEARTARILHGVRWLADSPDPVGAIGELQPQHNGLLVGRMRVPLGLLATVYESRPEVTVEASAMAIKSGNAIILRGSRECARTNQALATVIRTCLAEEGLSADVVHTLPDSSREALWELLTGPGRLDLVVVRGGDGFIAEVRRRSPYPVLASGSGNCHIFVDAGADPDDATRIVLNAKLSAPTMCNAVETVLVHEALADTYLPELVTQLRAAGVDMRGCPRTRAADPRVPAATEDDWSTEYLDTRLALRVVTGLETAIEHINRYGTGHSEAILTADLGAARRFQQEVDAAAVYVNASTRFTYGYEFGLGPMLGISTQKLHARGPVTVTDLTSEKYVITGTGQIRETP